MAITPLDSPDAVISEDEVKYVDWPAIFGAVTISSASTMLLGAAGVALGLAAVSPWSHNNPSPTAMSVAGAAWFALSALYAGAVGGYVVGRLRKPALDTTADERSNRDGLNALIAWGFGLLLTTVLTSSLVASGVGKTATVAAQATGPILSESVKASANQAGDFIGYYVDRALRTANAAAPGTGPAAPNDAKSEVARIVTHSLAAGSFSNADRADLEKLVARQAGISDADAKTRVDQMISQANDAYAKAVQMAKETADQARKITAAITTWFVIVSLLAAILAWYAGIIGGRHRDQNLLV
jgi:hypothetical protein